MEVPNMGYSTLLTLKTALADISAIKNTRKQSAITFEVFVLWLCNQCYYTHDVIGIKMTYGDLPYYKGIRAKACREYRLHENNHKKHTNHLHTFRKWSITWSQFIICTCSKLWLIRHSMMCTAIYSSCDSNIIKYGGPSQGCGSVKKTSCRSSSFHTK